MGASVAAGLAEFGRMGVAAHLASNLFPPQPRLLPVALAALEVASSAQPFPEGFLFEDVLDESIPMPEGVQFRGRDWITAREALDALRLHEFIDFEGDLEEDEEVAIMP